MSTLCEHKAGVLQCLFFTTCSSTCPLWYACGFSLLSTHIMSDLGSTIVPQDSPTVWLVFWLADDLLYLRSCQLHIPESPLSFLSGSLYFTEAVLLDNFAEVVLFHCCAFYCTDQEKCFKFLFILCNDNRRTWILRCGSVCYHAAVERI